MTKKKILIATGGTGGHIFPAYSLANYLKDKNFEIELTTDKRGLKYLQNYKNLNLKIIPLSPLKKNTIFTFLKSVLIILYSIIKSFNILLYNRPSIIFGMGGYASFPICIAASILRINFVIYENNLIIGKANKYLLPFAKKIFVSYNEVEGIPEKYRKKIFEIGNIVREEIVNFKLINNKDNEFNKLNILILGGSQGAKVFAEILPRILKKINESIVPIMVYQQCLKDQKNNLIKFYSEAKIDCEIFNFTDNIIDYYSKANLVITRSGASVLGELINIKIPLILIPLPTSADNHQYKNAEFYSKKGYGYLLDEREINDKLFNIVNSMYNDKSFANNFLSNQGKYSDKDIFKNLIIQLEKI